MRSNKENLLLRIVVYRNHSEQIEKKVFIIIVFYAILLGRELNSHEIKETLNILFSNSLPKSRNKYNLIIISIYVLIRFGIHKIKGYICK